MKPNSSPSQQESASANAASLVTGNPVQDFFVGRQPILDRQGGLVAYEILFRSSQQNRAQISDDMAATASVLSHVFFDLGLENALGPYQGFVNLDARMLMSDVIEALPPDRFVLEVLETVEATDEIVSRAEELKAKGYKLALDDFVLKGEALSPLVGLADIIKVDLMSMDQAELARTTAALKGLPVQLLAEKVDSEAQVAKCRALGYDFFQGYYFAKPTVIAGKKLSHSELALIRLLGLIIDEAETHALEAIFKEQPGLSFNLMRLTNSASVGASRKITSIRQAITMLGRRELQRWLQLLLYSGSSSKSPSALLRLAATRGRLMELLAGSVGQGREDLEDRAFMVGIMSLMPALLQIPISEITQPLNLASDVRLALEERAGVLGTMLALGESLESDDATACHDLIEQLPGVTQDVLNSSHASALTWANRINSDTPTSP